MHHLCTLAAPTLHRASMQERLEALVDEWGLSDEERAELRETMMQRGERGYGHGHGKAYHGHGAKRGN